MHIDDYAYGRIVIDGREEHRDVILTPPKVHSNWWRREGHALSVEDLGPVLEERPDLLVVGTGTAGNMRPRPELADILKRQGIAMEYRPTAQAVARFNELAEQDGARIAAALHLTC